MAVIFLSLMGAADAGYLLWSHRRVAADAAGSTGSAFCPAKGCEIVNQGEFANVRGVPLAAIGLAGYLTILGLSFLATIRRDRRAIQAILMVSGIGVIVSVHLVYLQIAVIKVICSYCVVSAFTMVSIFVLSIVSLGSALPPGQPGPAERKQAFEP